MKSELLIGKVLRPRGLKGEVRLEIYSSDPHLLAGYSGEVLIDGKAFRVRKFLHEGAFGYATLEGVDSREGAEALQGKEVYARREDLPAPKQGEHYIVDIIGLDVKVGGNVIGQIVDVAQYGSADVYTVSGADGKLSFPALKALIKDVDLQNDVMTLDPIVFERVVVRN